MKIDEELTFGRYAGMTIRQILHNNEGPYIIWLLDNINGFSLEPSSLEAAIRARYTKQYIALCRRKRNRK